MAGDVVIAFASVAKGRIEIMAPKLRNPCSGSTRNPGAKTWFPSSSKHRQELVRHINGAKTLHSRG
jgi:hypothetical protein